MVTLAGWLLIVFGAAGLLIGAVAALVEATGTGVDPRIGLLVALTASEIYAGTQVLTLKRRGLILGIVIAAIGVLSQVIELASHPGLGAGVLFYGLILGSLVTNTTSFGS